MFLTNAFNVTPLRGALEAGVRLYQSQGDIDAE
jgi:hypothetical protein